MLLVATHPVQYAVPLYRLYEADTRIDVVVAYCSLQGAEAGLDPEFGVELAWDLPLLDGYRWVNPRNHSPRPGIGGFFGLINPELWTLIRTGGFEVVICFGYRTLSFWIAAIAAKYFGAALVFATDAHSWDVREGLKLKSALKRVLVPRILGIADAVLAPSSRTVNHLLRMGVDDQRVVLTPHVVNTEYFARIQGASRVELRRGWGVPEDAPVALYVAKLVPWKRPQDLLEAAARVRGLHVVLIGEGRIRPELEARSAQTDLAGRVHFLGFVNQSQLPGVYRAGDFLVLPSEYEPFGLVVNEAFACGLTAVVTEACGCAGDLVRNGETGFVVPVGDATALSQELNTLATNVGLRKALSAKARARIDEWGPRENVNAMAEACKQLVQGRST